MKNQIPEGLETNEPGERKSVIENIRKLLGGLSPDRNRRISEILREEEAEIEIPPAEREYLQKIEKMCNRLLDMGVRHPINRGYDSMESALFRDMVEAARLGVYERTDQALLMLRQWANDVGFGRTQNPKRKEEIGRIANDYEKYIRALKRLRGH